MATPRRSKSPHTTSSTGAIIRALYDAIDQVKATDSILEAKDRVGVLAAAKDSIRVGAEQLNKRMEFEERIHKIKAPEGFWKNPKPELVEAKIASADQEVVGVGLEIDRQHEIRLEQMPVGR